jgi:protocatechuate 3,4-dioxygenase beta subunit
MSNINRLLLVLCLLVVSQVVCFSQTTPRDSAASVSGRVTLGSKPAAGFTIIATLSGSFFDNKTVAKAITDDEGNYKITGLMAGRIRILPLAKSYVVSGPGRNREAGQEVNVAEGETITKVDFALVRGGVITGRITDSEGHPLIGERISIVPKDSPADSRPQMMMLGASSRNQTDDRGIYRVYGLAPGSYKVSVGQAASAAGAVSIMGIGGSQYVKTYYPGVQEEAKATIIEIKEGTEVKDVDISVGKASVGFSVAGRVVDSDSGNPVVGVFIGHSTVNESNQQMSGMNFTGNRTDANGKFKLEGLRPGRYSVYTFGAGQENSTYSEPVQFEVADSDVTGIEIKVRRGVTINGVAVIENDSDPAVAGLLEKITLYAFVEQKSTGAPSYGQGRVGPDGSFHIGGLAPGKARIGMQGFPSTPKGLMLLRTEVEGLEQSEGIELTAGTDVNGVRLVFGYGTGSIRGELKIEAGSLPDGISPEVIIRSATGAPRRFSRSAEVDGRLHFLLENIPPGTYDLIVRGPSTVVPGSKPVPPVEFLKQTVTVSNGVEVKVTLVVDLTGKKVGQP